MSNNITRFISFGRGSLIILARLNYTRDLSFSLLKIHLHFHIHTHYNYFKKTLLI